MLLTWVDNALAITSSMALLPCGHPDALPEVQRQMRMIIQSYSDPTVLRLGDDVVRHAALLHGEPGGDSEDLRRERARAAVGRLRACLENLPDPGPRIARLTATR